MVALVPVRVERRDAERVSSETVTPLFELLGHDDSAAKIVSDEVGRITVVKSPSHGQSKGSVPRPQTPVCGQQGRGPCNGADSSICEGTAKEVFGQGRRRWAVIWNQASKHP